MEKTQNLEDITREDDKIGQGMQLSQGIPRLCNWEILVPLTDEKVRNYLIVKEKRLNATPQEEVGLKILWAV